MTGNDGIYFSCNRNGAHKDRTLVNKVVLIAGVALLFIGSACKLNAQYAIPDCAKWAFGNMPGVQTCIDHHCIEPREILFDENRNLLIIAGEVRENDLLESGDAFQRSNGGGVDLFLVVYSIDMKNAIYTTYLGGGGDEILNSLSSIDEDRVALVGYTNSVWFPSLRGKDGIRVRGNSDGLYAIFNLDSLVFEKIELFGSESIDQLQTVISRSDRLYLFGTTSGVLPVTENAVMNKLNSGTGVQKSDAFIAIVKDSTIEYCTYFGGNEDDGLSGAVLLDSTRIFIQLLTSSEDLPVTADAISASRSRYGSSGIAIMTSDGGLEYCSYISGDEWVTPGDAIALKGDSLFLIGTTLSSDLPTTGNAWQRNPVGDLISGYFMIFNWRTHALEYSTYIACDSYVLPLDIISARDTSVVLYLITECDSLGSFRAPDNGPAPNVWFIAADFNFFTGVTDQTKLLADPLVATVSGVCDGGYYYYSTGYSSSGLRVCFEGANDTVVSHDAGFIYKINQDVPLAITDVEGPTILITASPNPADSYINIRFSGYPIEGSIVVYNSIGREIDRIIVKENCSAFNIDIATYPKGLFFLRYTDKNGETQLLDKFIVLR